jgi:hypothetical protein
MDKGERMERADDPASQPVDDVMAARVASMEAKIARRDKLALIKDLFVPVVTLMLMYLGYRLNADANARQIAEAEQAQVRAAEARNQKYLEFFLANFADKAKQPAAFAVLGFLDTPFRARFVYNLSAGLDLEPATWDAIVRIGDVLDFGDLQGFRVEVYHAGDAGALAQGIQQGLQKAGFKGEIRVQEVSEQFWDNYGGKPDTNEVRFELGTEDRAAKYLARFLQTKLPEAAIALRPTLDSSRPRSVAVWLPHARPSP